MIQGLKMNRKQMEKYMEDGSWGTMTLADYWHESVALYPDREYVADDRGNRYTYAQMDEKAAVLAAYLKDQGVRPGDVVSFQVPIWSEFVMITVAALKVGAVVNPVGMCFQGEELQFLLNLSKSKVFFCPTWFHKTDYESNILSIRDALPRLQSVVLLENGTPIRSMCPSFRQILDSYSPLKETESVDSNSVALILCTSGTTRGTKEVMLTHNNLIYSESCFNEELGLTRDDIMFMPAPLNHATGFNHGLISPMLLGAKVILQEKFRCREAIELMNREKCTYSMGATPFIYDILKEMEETSARLPYMRFYLCGGAPVPGVMVQRAWKYGILLCEVYGSTESCPHVFVHPDEALALNGTTSGRPMKGVEVRLVDDQGKDVPPGTPGEEISRGPNVFVGYLNDPAATDQSLDEDGWFYSGDICVGDENGNIRVIGRKKDMIVRGGENLNANDIDNDIEGCPGVSDHAVVGMPDERLGERICAFLVLQPGAETVTQADVIEHFKKQKINKRYWPERVELIDRIPRTDSGKVKKYLLVEELKKRMDKKPPDPSALMEHCHG